MLLNFYGSTEVTGDGTAAVLTETDRPHIGRPVPNTTVHVLDSWLRPVPVGVAGELYVGGVQLADGYTARAGLTAARFVADPFSPDGARLYRTGDVVRWSPHGRLEYLGRSDDQVKIRGFRIELDDIRTALELHPAVSGAVVIASDHPAGGKFLTAYVTVTAGAPAGDTALLDALREHVAQHLPKYMVPTVFTRLDAFPVTANGKLDRRALPEPDLTSPTTGGRAPETATETALAAIFRDVLHLDDGTPLNVNDDFFRLGGDSIVATRLVALTRKQDLHFTLRDVFEQRTIDRLAAMAVSAPGTPPAAPALIPNPTMLELLRNSGTEINAYMLTECVIFPSRVTGASVVSAFESLVADTDALRLSVDTSNRRLWFTHLLPSESVRPETLELAAPGDGSVDALRAAAVDLVDMSAGRPAGLAYTRTPERTVSVLAVHAAVADRASVHHLAELLEQSVSGGVVDVPRPGSLVRSLEAIDLAGEKVATDRLDQWNDLCARSQTIDTSAFSRGSIAILRWERSLTDDAVRCAVRNALRSSGVTKLVGGVLDEEVSLAPVNGSTEVGPFTATTPVAIDEDELGATSEFALLRYHNKVGRRALRRTPSPAVLVTRAHAPDHDSAAPEGNEQRYQGIIRYRIDLDAVTVTLLGFADQVAAKLRKATAEEFLIASEDDETSDGTR